MSPKDVRKTKTRTNLYDDESVAERVATLHPVIPEEAKNYLAGGTQTVLGCSLGHSLLDYWDARSWKTTLELNCMSWGTTIFEGENDAPRDNRDQIDATFPQLLGTVTELLRQGAAVNSLFVVPAKKRPAPSALVSIKKNRVPVGVVGQKNQMVPA